MPCRKGKGPANTGLYPGRIASEKEALSYMLFFLFKKNHSGSRRGDKLGKGKIKRQRDKTLKLLQKSTPKW